MDQAIYTEIELSNDLRSLWDAIDPLRLLIANIATAEFSTGRLSASNPDLLAIYVTNKNKILRIIANFTSHAELFDQLVAEKRALFITHLKIIFKFLLHSMVNFFPKDNQITDEFAKSFIKLVNTNRLIIQEVLDFDGQADLSEAFDKLFYKFYLDAGLLELVDKYQLFGTQGKALVNKLKKTSFDRQVYQTMARATTLFAGNFSLIYMLFVLISKQKIGFFNQKQLDKFLGFSRVIIGELHLNDQDSIEKSIILLPFLLKIAKKFIAAQVKDDSVVIFYYCILFQLGELFFKTNRYSDALGCFTSIANTQLLITNSTINDYSEFESIQFYANLRLVSILLRHNQSSLAWPILQSLLDITNYNAKTVELRLAKLDQNILFTSFDEYKVFFQLQPLIQRKIYLNKKYYDYYVFLQKNLTGLKFRQDFIIQLEQRANIELSELTKNTQIFLKVVCSSLPSNIGVSIIREEANLNLQFNDHEQKKVFMCACYKKKINVKNGANPLLCVIDLTNVSFNPDHCRNLLLESWHQTNTSYCRSLIINIIDANQQSDYHPHEYPAAAPARRKKKHKRRKIPVAPVVVESDEYHEPPESFPIWQVGDRQLGFSDKNQKMIILGNPILKMFGYIDETAIKNIIGNRHNLWQKIFGVFQRSNTVASHGTNQEGFKWVREQSVWKLKLCGTGGNSNLRVIGRCVQTVTTDGRPYSLYVFDTVAHGH